MTLLLALDPGRTTGYSYWSYSATEPLTNIEHGQIVGGVKGFISFWRQMPTPEEVVAETFRLDGRTMFPDTTPLEIEGALHVLFPDWIGQANTAKSLADDLLLKRTGWWFRGEDHARDSARHAVALMKTRRHVPTLMRISPPR